MKKTLRAALVASFAVLAAGAAHAETLPANAQTTLMRHLKAVNLRTEESLTRLVVASADARLRSKIDNIMAPKSFPTTLPAFTMASAFTD